MRRGMPLLRLNTVEFEYLPKAESLTDVNEFGEHTGDFTERYGKPVKYRGNISVPSGYDTQNLFGTDTRYSHVLVMRNPDTDIRETGMIRYNGELYEIRSVKPSINQFSAALRKKTSDEGGLR